MPSGPAAFLGLRFFGSFSISGTVMLMMGIVGCGLSPWSGRFSRSSPVSTEQNCWFKVFAFSFASL